jgi:deoxyribodipyrimidine photo-lyase
MTDKKYKKSLIIFRRDLRLEDNTALLAACESSEEVIPLFCFDPRQADEGHNDYFSNNAFRFMCDALLELDKHLRKRNSRLHVGTAKPDELLDTLLADSDIQAVFFNQDYTPFSVQRDKQMKSVCELYDVDAQDFHDVALTVPGEVLTQAGDPYRVFTPFERKARKQQPQKPRRNNFDNFGRLDHPELDDVSVVRNHRPDTNNEIFQTGGRNQATSILQCIKDFQDYKDERNEPSTRGTTRLSAHLKFGTISPRELYWAVAENLSVNHGLISELYWRDFYLHISWHFPEVFGENFNSDYDGIPWENDKEKFQAWQRGLTGFPIVDAGMRELTKSGWMHNRVRMIVASFLTKDLNIDWRWGEKHFAHHLVDYDPSSNNGGWQWAASTGADAQPYFRIFNPWTQGKTHDPDVVYIKKWLPELSNMSADRIHKIVDKGVPDDINYPNTIVDHKKMYHEAIARYKRVKNNA